MAGLSQKIITDILKDSNISTITSLSNSLMKVLNSGNYSDLNKLKASKDVVTFAGVSNNSKYKNEREKQIAYLSYWLPKVSKEATKIYDKIAEVRATVSKLDPNQGSAELERAVANRLAFVRPDYESVNNGGIISKQGFKREESILNTIIHNSGEQGVFNPRYNNLLREGVLKKTTTKAFLESLVSSDILEAEDLFTGDKTKSKVYNFGPYLNSDKELHFSLWSGSIYEFQYTQFIKLLYTNNPNLAANFSEFLNTFIRRSGYSLRQIGQILAQRNSSGESIWDVLVSHGSDLDERDGHPMTFEDLKEVFLEFAEDSYNSRGITKAQLERLMSI